MKFIEPTGAFLMTLVVRSPAFSLSATSSSFQYLENQCQSHQPLLYFVFSANQQTWHAHTLD